MSTQDKKTEKWGFSPDKTHHYGTVLEVHSKANGFTMAYVPANLSAAWDIAKRISKLPELEAENKQLREALHAAIFDLETAAATLHGDIMGLDKEFRKTIEKCAALLARAAAQKGEKQQ
jgi:hypothetical protein